MNTEFEINEFKSSQEPAVQLLVAMGYEYVSPAETLKQRKGRGSNVLLEGVMEEKLKELNRVHHKGQEYLFSEENIQTAIQKLKNTKYDGLVRTNEVVYDLITLGTALEQTVEGDSKSFNLNYIDWKIPSRNSYHVTVEYGVENYRKSGHTRPDVVLFINGIPFCVIECKAPQVEVEQAVSQMIRNQGDEHIPQLFTYSQLVIAVNKNEAKYATTGTVSKFWSIWKEEEDTELAKLVNEGLNYQLVKEDGYELTKHNSPTAPSGEATSRLVTEQDRAIYALCRPKRLIELAWKFTLYDGGIKKVARYQQYFVIKSTLERVKEYEDVAEDSRKGGVIWHTQGSGKSLTMVMLTRNLALDPELKNPRIVLVTDRDDLDKQLGNTFIACGLEAKRATSGKNLLDLVARQSASIITTIINKFEGAMKLGKASDDSANIFVLVDEGHRTQFGTYAARMRQVFPNASYLGFTGTPLVKKDKNNFQKFGQLIEPYYSILQAVEDGAVVPLLYEGRHVELEQDQKAIDKWFERHTSGLSKEQKADLKRKYARAEMLNKADKVIYERSFDISEHFRKSWQATGFKAQLVAPSKLAALKYHEYLEELGIVSSAVIISPPDMREGHEEVDDEPTDEVVKFWKKMMQRYGSEADYTKGIINQFKNGNDPEILIVVDKLLTGFDAPRNTVLYLCRKLKEHTLLQAIARVNRLHENKEFGYIVDYVNILEELDQSLTMYGAFEGFDEEDLRGSLTSIQTEVEKLPDSYSALWEVFKTVRTSYDAEAYELLLADEEIREEFYVRLSDFAKKLSIALSSERFLNEVETDTLDRYKRDLRKFHKLKLAVKQRYAEAVDYKEYEPKIKKLLDTHIMADEAIQLNEPVNIFDNEAFTQVKEDQAVYNTGPSAGAKADTIAHNTKRVISENYDKDPSFYDKFSKLIQQAIDDFRAKRISDLEYLDKSRVYSEQVNGSIREDLPASLKHREEAAAYYGVFLQMIDGENAEAISAETGIKVEEIFQKRFKVGFWNDPDAVNLVENDIEDFLYETVRDVYEIKLSGEQMSSFIKDALKIAKSRTS